MNRILKTTAIAAAALTVPAMASAQNYNQTYNQGYNTNYLSPHDACKKKEDKKQIIGGLIGAVAGGVLGSQVSGNGARTEGSAIGVIAGGLLGAGIADKSIDCDPAYPTQSVPRGYDLEQSSGYQNSGYQSQDPYQGQYQDRITVSNHPVYSDPYYGARTGAVSQGTTYNTGTVTYPTQTYNQGYNNGYTTTGYQQAPVYSQPTYTQTSYSQPIYNTYGATHSSGYITRDPHYRPKPVRGARHFHGSFECSGIH